MVNAVISILCNAVRDHIQYEMRFHSVLEEACPKSRFRESATKLGQHPHCCNMFSIDCNNRDVRINRQGLCVLLRNYLASQIEVFSTIRFNEKIKKIIQKC